MGSVGLLIRKNVTRLNVRKAVVAILRSGDLDAYAKIVREAAEPLDGDGYFYTPQIGKNFKRNRSLNLFGSTKWLIPRDIWHCDVAITPECESFWSEIRGVIVRQKHLCELPDKMEGDCQQPHPYSNWEYRVELTDIEVKREAADQPAYQPRSNQKARRLPRHRRTHKTARTPHERRLGTGLGICLCAGRI
jgi:hypothetical protein